MELALLRACLQDAHQVRCLHEAAGVTASQMLQYTDSVKGARYRRRELESEKEGDYLKMREIS